MKKHNRWLRGAAALIAGGWAITFMPVPSALAGALPSKDAPPMNSSGWVEVSSAVQLEYIDQNQGSYLNSKIELMNNIDLSGYGWVPIGQSTSGHQFIGTFDGGGYEISHLTVNNSTFDTGFFGYVGGTGTIRNVGLTSVNVTGTGNVGGLVGKSFGAITNSFVSGSVKSTGSNVAAGGVVGWNNGTITNAFATGSVKGGSASNAGGVVGDNESSISNVYFTGSVSVGSGGETGGVLAYNHGSVSDSYTDVSPLSAYNVSGYSSVSGSSVESLSNMELQSTYGSTWDFTTTATVGIPSPQTFPTNLNSVTISGTTGAAITKGNKITYNYLENTIGTITLSDSKGHSQNVSVSSGQSTVTVTNGAFQGLTLNYTDHNDNQIYQNTITVTGPSWGIRAGKTTPYLLVFKPSLTVNPLASTKFSAVQNTLSVTGSVYDGSVGEPIAMDYDIQNNSNVSVTSVTYSVYANGGAQSIDHSISLAGWAAGSYTLHVSAKDTYNAASNATPQSFSIEPTLSGLSLSQGTLSTSFSNGTTNYTANVATSVNTITVTPTVADPGDTVTVDGKAVTSGSASASISLTVGSNPITVVVTAQDGTTTNTYTIDVNRAVASSNANLSGLTLSRGSLSPKFASGTTSYTTSVTNSISSVTVTPTVSDNTATVTVDGKSVTNGSASGPITLNVGRNHITIVVTAQSGATQTYTVTVNRNSPIPVPSLSVGTSFAWDGQYGVPYNPLQLQAVYGFGPYTWSVVSGSLPSGLTLSKGGLITGTPTGPDGISTFTVQVQARNGEARRTLSILIKGAPALSIKTGTVLPTGLPDNAFGQTLTATGGNPPYTWSIVKGMLPSGLNLNASTGVLSGITTDTRPEIVTVEVQDAKGVTQDKQVVIDVLPKDEREIVLETPRLTAENVPAFTARDSGVQTTYMPIWYVMQLLKPLGITSTWDGKNWRMVADSQTDLSTLNAGHGTTTIYLNGTVVQKVDTVAATDPWAVKATTYMPIWYVMQLLKRVGLQSTWNGTTWTVTK